MPYIAGRYVFDSTVDEYNEETHDTCGWCTQVTPIDELESNEHIEGALLCNDCADLEPDRMV